MHHIHWLSRLATAACLGAIPFSQSAAAPAGDCCSVIELRQYINYPGTRDALIDLFEQRFVESQEAVGIRVLATFRDVNEPNHFIWLRGFPGMEARKKSLTDFYYGDLWKANRNAANATLYDNDNVLLLRPAVAGGGFAFDPAQRPVPGAALAGTFVTGNIYHFAQPVTPQFIETFERTLMPLFEKHGARVVARLVSEKSANTFPQLPVREDANVFVWFARFDDRAAFERYQASLAQDPQWRGELFSVLYKSLARPPEVLMLAPTARSLLR
jgi:hypothetical protein